MATAQFQTRAVKLICGTIIGQLAVTGRISTLKTMHDSSEETSEDDMTKS